MAAVRSPPPFDISKGNYRKTYSSKAIRQPPDNCLVEWSQQALEHNIGVTDQPDNVAVFQDRRA